MLESFITPGSMLAGAALVSVPIIIHLINRLRFKRVRWAAMEFLLKAQKRMKRKLIIQQLLLLLLRCLMVALLGLLTARFLGFNPFQGREGRTTNHLVVLDDSPSMADGWSEERGGVNDSFGRAKSTITDEIAKAAADATNPQMLDMVRLSDLNTVKSFNRVNATSINEATSHLNTLTPSTVRGSLVDGLSKAKAIADGDSPETARVIHLISDFRSVDWEIDGPAMRTIIEDLTKRGVKVHLIDVAHPFRKDEKRPPQAHDNVAIVELSPARRVVPRFESTEFTVRVRNYGVAELKDLRVVISVNGNDNAAEARSLMIPTLPGNQEELIRFKLNPERMGTADKPLERFTIVSARLENVGADPLTADNVRHTVVEVRDKLPILAIDGRPTERDKKEGDSFYLRNIFTNVAGGYAWQPGTVRDLETQDLKQFSCIFLMNVPALSENAAKNLEQYVKDGGGAGFFLGPDCKPMDYNSLLYRDGEGLFPVPLPEKPSEMLPDEKVLEKLFNFQKKLLLRDKAMTRHEALRNIYFTDRDKEDKENAQGLEKFYNFVLVKQYWPIKRLGKWREDSSIKELYCMPNEGSMGQYEPAALALMNKLPNDEPKYAKFKDALNVMKVEIRKVASSTEPLFKLATVLDRLLSDQISEGDPVEALYREFWALPEMADLKNEAVRLRDAVKYGDPLYLARTYGKGRVTLVTTTAGEQWTDWPAGPGGRSYPPIMTEMERYLSGGGAADSPATGSTQTWTVDAARYKEGVNWSFLTVDYGKGGGGTAGVKQADISPPKEQKMVAEKGMATLKFNDSTKPGAYLFTFTRLNKSSAGTDAEVPEYDGVAFNIDSIREGDLRRAGRDDVLQSAPGAALHSPGDTAWLDELKNKRTDLTEAGWIFLVLLLVLIAEQYMAVKLSFHTHEHAVETAAPSAAATFQRPMAQTPGEAA